MYWIRSSHGFAMCIPEEKDKLLTKDQKALIIQKIILYLLLNSVYGEDDD